VARLRKALGEVDRDSAAAKRKAKSERAAQLRKSSVDGEKDALDHHLAVAKAAAENRKLPVATVKKVAAPAKPAGNSSASKPAIRMAPGHKPKPLPTVSAAHTGLTAAGFKPLQHARPAAAITISVAAAPKPKPPKIVDYDDDERTSRKGKKGREGQKSFDKKIPRIAPQVPQQGSRISVNEELKEISIRGAVIVKDLAAKNQLLQILGDAHLGIDLPLDGPNAVAGFHLQRDRLAGQRLDGNLHGQGAARQGQQQDQTEQGSQ
jgi:hypothetical protein